MTTDMPADLTRVRDHSHDPVVAAAHHVETWWGDHSKGGQTHGWQCLTCGAEAEGFSSFTAAETAGSGHVSPPAAGWTPPPPQDSAYYTPLCAHRDEIAYEHDMDHVAALRRVADEIREANMAIYPNLVARPVKKRRTTKKAKP